MVIISIMTHLNLDRVVSGGMLLGPVIGHSKATIYIMKYMESVSFCTSYVLGISVVLQNSN